MSSRDIGIANISLRHLKAALQVAEHRNVTRAAEKLNRSQTAITKSIIDLERELGVNLFDRSTSGMSPTVYGEALAARVRLALNEFESAGVSYAEHCGLTRNFSNIPIFSMDISYKRFAAFIALFDYRDVEQASKTLEVTRAAIYNSVRELEALLDIKLFNRTANGIEPTDYCRVLARHTKLAFAQIRHGLAEISSLDGVLYGQVIVGTLPYTRTMIVPRAINLLLEEHPNLDISTREGLYLSLESSLRGGDIDFLIGALRPPRETPDLKTELLFKDKISVVARTDHPLASKRNIEMKDLHDARWILPPKDAPSRLILDDFFEQQGLSEPEHCIETGSFSTARGILLESDCVALLSEHLIHYEQQLNLLAPLDVALKESSRSIGVTMLARTTLSPAAKLFLEKLRVVAKEFSDERS